MWNRLVLSVGLLFLLLAASCGGGSSTQSMLPGSKAIKVSVSPQSVTVPAGSAQQFTATVVGSSETGVSWFVGGQPGGNATVGTISPYGLYTAPGSVPSPALVTVTAALQSNPSNTGSASVVVVSPAVSVTVSPAVVGLVVRTTQQFTADVKNEADASVTWSVNGVVGGNGIVGTISSSGLYTAPFFAPAENVFVDAVSVADPSKSGGALVVVHASATSFAYVSSASDDTIEVFAVSDSAQLTSLGVSVVPTGQHPGFLAMHPSGKFLYSLNQGSDDISAFAIDIKTGQLTLIGKTPAPSHPYAMVLTANGDFAYVSCDPASEIAAYSVDPETGALTATSNSPYSVGGGQLQGLALTPDGTSLYVTDASDSRIYGFVADAYDGTFAPIPGSPFPAGAGVGSIAAEDSFVVVGNRSENTVSAYGRDPSSGQLTFSQATQTGGDSPELFHRIFAEYALGVNSSGGGIFALEAGPGGLQADESASTGPTPIPGSVYFFTSFYPVAYVLNPSSGTTQGGSIAAYRVFYDGVSGPLATVPTSSGHPTAFAITP